GDGNLANTNNRNLGNTPAETQRNTKLVERNNQDYVRIDKSKGEDFCSGTDCYGKATQKRLKKSFTNPNVIVTITNKKNTSSNYSNYQVREIQDKNGKVIAYSAYNPNTGKNIVMKPEELTTFKGLVENNLMDSFENASNYQNTASNALNNLHDDGKIGGTVDSWKQYAKSGDIVLDLAGGLGGGVGAKIFKVTKKTTKINYRSGKELNKLENKGNKSREDAWVNEENVIERKFDADSGLSRVHSNPRRPKGKWIGRTKDFQNPDGTLKSASQIKKEFALPNTPKYITPLKEVSFKGLSGRIAKNKFGQGGKQQIEILKRNEKIPKKWFDTTKTKKLPQ
ncbi:hypothetical protein AZO1586I_1095, partial [Bathymodiolus thermophilus thioautotrophic gill symbiont]